MSAEANFQAALHAALSGDAALSALVVGGFVGGFREEAVYPYVKYGTLQSVPLDLDDLNSWDIFRDLNVYSRRDGVDTEAANISRAIIALLHREGLTERNGYRFPQLVVSGPVITEQPDGLTVQAALTVRARVNWDG